MEEERREGSSPAGRRGQLGLSAELPAFFSRQIHFPWSPPTIFTATGATCATQPLWSGSKWPRWKERGEKKKILRGDEWVQREWVSGLEKGRNNCCTCVTKKRMWTQMKNAYGASCVVDVEAKIDINRPTGVYYICMRKKWICPNVQMSINNTAGGDDIISQVVHVVFISLPPTDALKTALMQTNHFLGLFLFLIARFFFFSNVTHISRTN